MKKFAFVFPGQGSQGVGMMAPYGEHTVVRDTFAQASEVLGFDLWRLVAEGPQEVLDSTLNTQPAMLAAGVAVYRLWQAMGGGQPHIVAGHSLGEYTALVCAGALDFADAVRLVRQRAEAMQSAVPAGEGAMAAILGLEDAAVQSLCQTAAGSEVLEAVNYNAPGQVVIAGHRQAVERAMALAKERGAKRAILLPVSVPSHCSLMRQAAERLRQALSDVRVQTPVLRVIHNADVAEHRDADTIRDALVRQLYRPVRWVETVRTMQAEGVALVAECGPGKVLTGLNKRILEGVPSLALADAAGMTETQQMLSEGP